MLAAIALPALIVAVVLLQPFVPGEVLVRDPLAAVHTRVRETPDAFCCSRYLGSVSQLGLMLWSAAAAVAGFGCVLLASRRAFRGAACLGITAVYTASLALDDGLMLHEGLDFQVFGLGLFEMLYAAGLLAVVASLVLLARHEKVRASVFLLLLGATFAFAASVTVDSFLPQRGATFVIEDGFKLVGIGLWMAFVIRLGLDLTLGPSSPDHAVAPDGSAAPGLEEPKTGESPPTASRPARPTPS